MFRIAALSPKWNHLIKLASKDVLAFGILEAKMDKLLTRFTPIVSENLSEQVKSQAVSVLETSKTAPEFLDPPQSQCKGRKKKPARWKSGIEKALKKRTCQYCQKKGHNIRTCPKLQQDLEKRKGKGINQTHEEETSDEEQDFEDDGMEDDESE